MKRFGIGIVLIVSIAVLFSVTGCVQEGLPDEPTVMSKDGTRFPLEKINVNDNSEYMLAMRDVSSKNGSIRIINDTALLKANRESFYIINDEVLYSGKYSYAPDGEIELYKDGQRIEYCPFDRTHTIETHFGSLKNRFTQVNELTLLTMLNAKVIESDAHYTVVQRQDGNNQYYYTFVHTDDKADIEHTKTVDITGSPMKITKVNDYIIEIIHPIGENDFYEYYNINTGVLTSSFSNVRARNGEIIVYHGSTDRGSLILVRNIFDEKIYYEYDFGHIQKGEPFNRLETAEFIEEDSVRIEYIDNDGNIIEKILKYR